MIPEKKNQLKYPLVFIISVLLSLNLTGQDTIQIQNQPVEERDLVDVIRDVLNRPEKDRSKKTGSLLLVPIIGSNPATGFMFGVGGQYAYRAPGTTLYSMWMGSVQFTTKSQLLVLIRNNIYTKNNRFFLSGDWRFQIYSQDTYGLGTTAPEDGLIDYQYNLMGLQTTMDSLAQPMKFNFLRLYQTLSIKLSKGLYAGLGYYLDYYYNIVDEKLSLDPENTLLTSHYLYNIYYDFPVERYYFSSLNLCLQYDTRDNMINAYEGVYASLSWRGGSRILGNKYAASMFHLEWRSFHGLSKRNPRHLVAFWIQGNFSKAGKIPYMILPATAYDQRSRNSRGYTQGRYRGANYFYVETEYRFPISKPGGVLGGVLFLNATTADNKDLNLKLFEAIKPGYGFGLRIKADKHSRTNLAVDIGFGYRSAGFYLAASEVF